MKGFTKEGVYEKVSKITKGSFSTYKKVAEALGSKAYQAVGKCLRVHGCVIDKNGDDVINLKVCGDVHCYRVINHDYSIGGYVFKGIKKHDKKRELLEKEGIRFEKKGAKWFVIEEDWKKLFTFKSK